MKNQNRFIQTLSAAMLIATAGFSQITNPGLESWLMVAGSSGNYDNPKDWGNTNSVQDLLGDPVSITKSTDKHSGSYAMKMQSSADMEIETTAGADPISYNIGDGFPFTQRPAKLQFYYKFSGSYDVTVSVVFTANGGTEVVGDGDLTISAAKTAYTIAEIPMNYLTGNNPDHAVIWITMSQGTGSVLYVDDFAFTGSVGINENMEVSPNLVVFPNPSTSGIFTIHSDLNSTMVQDKMTAQITDVTGRMVAEYDQFVVASNDHVIDLSSYSSGIYFLNVSNGKNTYYKKLVVE